MIVIQTTLKGKQMFQTPSNQCKHPISELIERLQKLPDGTTYEIVDESLYGGEVPYGDLGTSYQMQIDICEGFNPPRPVILNGN